MNTASPTVASASAWRIRREGAADQGRVIDLGHLVQGIEDGLWSETDEVLPPHGVWTLIGDHPELDGYLPHTRLFKGSKLEDAEMDMTPMIDVTFQLLIFFMIAATYMVQKTLDMPKPDQSQEGDTVVKLSELLKNNVQVQVTAAGVVSVQGSPTTFDALENALSAAVKSSGNSELVLDADPETPHDYIVKVLDAAAGASIEKVHFVSREPAKNP